MFKKSVLGIAAAATVAAGTVFSAAPASAGYWYHNTWYTYEAPRHYHCHWEWRRVQVWHHGYARWVREKVRVCH